MKHWRLNFNVRLLIILFLEISSGTAEKQQITANICNSA